MTVKNDGPFPKAPEFSVGVSDVVLLVVSGIGFVMLAVTMYSIIITRLKSAKEIEEEEELNYDEKLANADVSTLNRAQRRARARHIMKQQRRIIAPSTTAGENAHGENEEEDHDEPVQPANPLLRNLSRKERQKAAKAAEKEERALFEEDRRRQHLEAQEVAQREKKERERLMAERAEEDRRARQEQRQAEEMAAYEHWKTFLASLDGTTTLSVKEWVKELEKTRTVFFDNLANRFQIPREDVVSRIQELLASSRITGLIEPDGRFIYISKEEMSSIASFIQTQDKVFLRQVVDKMDKIIGL
jgi:hypothetical protein